MKLAQAGLSGTACGKAILIGEHAAVDGHPAIALPLRSLTLTIRFAESLESFPEQTDAFAAWSQAWSLKMGEREVPLPSEERTRLTQSLHLALCLLLNEHETASPLSRYAPQRIEIDSMLPLGAGMGGSAALSAALLRALAAALGMQKSNAEIAERANELDGFFHGRASGLDAATVVSDGIIRFKKGVGSERVNNRTSFWLLLVDTRERTPTRSMVERVSQLRREKPDCVEQNFQSIASLCEKVRHNLQQGELLAFGENLNAAHESLQALQVSSEGLDACVVAMRKAGALGAKLTGGGGGGLALAVFAARPALPLSAEWSDYPHYLTFVPADENP